MSALVQKDEVRLTSQDRLLTLIRAKHPEYHPVLSMVEIALGEERAGEEGDRALAFACHKEVAKYVVAVDRVSEIKAEVTKTKRVIVELFGAEPPKPLENIQSPVMAAGSVEDATVTRTTILNKGPVEESDAELPQAFSPLVQVMGDPVATGMDERRGLGYAEQDIERTYTTSRMS